MRVRPERTARQVFDWAVRQAVVADEAGFSEYWIGEHATLAWESIPNPELIIAAAAYQTKNISLGPLAHLVPYYHPASLAIQTAWMSQILEGRYKLGIATGAYPSDAALRGITDMAENGEMMVEAMKIMDMVWKQEPFSYQGDFWKAGFPEVDPTHPFRDMGPHGGKIEMAMTGLSKNSFSMKIAGAQGHTPVSVYAGDEFLRTHWQDYSAAAEENGHKVDRSMHHVVRDVIIADTDKEARKLAIDGGLGHAWDEYIGPTYKRFGVMQELLHDKTMNVDDVDAEYLAEHVWIVGSPETVTEKFEEWFDRLGGGFGTLLIYSHDFLDNPKPWEESMQRLAQEVAPKISIKELAAA
jgi:alkanesulfonate monooxygenase SsuD/methylene tetrahydromethanopterin reductase-like flavin-dependent oxidoreductase (luciferase family)